MELFLFDLLELLQLLQLHCFQTENGKRTRKRAEEGGRDRDVKIDPKRDAPKGFAGPHPRLPCLIGW